MARCLIRNLRYLPLMPLVVLFAGNNSMLTWLESSYGGSAHPLPDKRPSEDNLLSSSVGHRKVQIRIQIKRNALLHQHLVSVLLSLSLPPLIFISNTIQGKLLDVQGSEVKQAAAA